MLSLNNQSTTFVDENNDECLDDVLNKNHVRVSFIALYCVMFLMCFFGNLFTIVVICAHRSMRTSTNFFLANLAVADLLVAVFCILQNMLHIFGSENGHWPLGETLCKLYITVIHLVPFTSIGILCLVSVEKYIAILHPLLALKLLTPKLRLMCVTGVWLMALLFNLPYYFTTREFIYHGFGVAACGRSSDEHEARAVITASFIIWYCIPVVSIAIMYSRIGLVLWNGSLKTMTVRASKVERKESNNSASVKTQSANSNEMRTSPNSGKSMKKECAMNSPRRKPEVRISALKIAASNNENESESDENEKAKIQKKRSCWMEIEYSVPGKGPTNISRSHSKSNVNATVSLPKIDGWDSAIMGLEIMESRKKIIRLLIIIVASFVILTLPHHLRLLNTMWATSPHCNNSLEALFQPVSYLLLFLSSSLNPFLYAFMSQRFREAVRDIVKCRAESRLRKSTRTTRTGNSEIQTVVAAPTCVGESFIQGSSTTSATVTTKTVGLASNPRMVHLTVSYQIKSSMNEKEEQRKHSVRSLGYSPTNQASQTGRRVRSLGCKKGQMMVIHRNSIEASL